MKLPERKIVPKLQTDLEFSFDLDDDIPDVNYTVPLKTKEQQRNRINIQKKKKHGRDSSINSKLF